MLSKAQIYIRRPSHICNCILFLTSSKPRRRKQAVTSSSVHIHVSMSSLNIEKQEPETLQTRSRETGHDQKYTRDPVNQPFSNGFFDKDPITSSARAEYLKLIVAGAMLISIAIWAVLTIYWGALWKTEDLIHHLDGWVVVHVV
jgi:hypothetical protein